MTENGPIWISKARANQPEPAKPAVTIVGAGIAGMTAAHELAKRGYEVTLLEAGTRVGGCMYSAETKLGDGKRFEHGGEMIDSDDEALIELCNELKAELEPSRPAHRTGSDLFVVGGKRYSEEEVLEAYQPFADHIAKIKANLCDEKGNWTHLAQHLDHVSMEQFILHSSQGAPEWLQTIIRQGYASFCGGDPAKLSALSLIDFIGADTSEGFLLYGDCDEAFRVKGGTSRIIHALEAALEAEGVTIKRGHEVKAVMTALDEKRLVVSHNDIEVIMPVEQLVFALPFYALRGIDGIDKLGLSDGQLDVINTTNYTKLTKVGLQLKGHPWKDVSHDGLESNGVFIGDGAYQAAWISHDWEADAATERSAGALVSFLIGGEQEKGGISKLVKQAKADYAAAFGKAVEDIFDENAPTQIAQWSAEGKGCYASPAPGQYIKMVTMEHHNEAGDVGLIGSFSPKANVHCSTKTGFMNNAAESGVQEALRIHERWQAKAAELETATAISPAAVRLSTAAIQQI